MDNQRFEQYIQFIKENPLIDEEALAASINDKTAQRQQLLAVVDQVMGLVDSLYDEAHGNFSAPIGELELRLKQRRKEYDGNSKHTDLSWFWYRYCNLEFKMLMDTGYTAKDAKAAIMEDPDFIRNYKRLTGRKTPPSQRMINQRLQIKKIDKELESA